MTGPFDGTVDRPLVLGAIARDPAGDDLAFFSQVLDEPFDVFVIDDRNLFPAKAAEFFPEKPARAPVIGRPAAGAAAAGFTSGSHGH